MPVRIITLALAAIFAAASVAAAPLTAFDDNIFQIDIALAPIISCSSNGTNYSNSHNTSELSGNLTVALSPEIALRAGGTSLSGQPVSWPWNPGTELLSGTTQLCLQAVYNPVEYFQPFAGLQYATCSIKKSQGNNWVNADYKNVGVCAGVQIEYPFADLIIVNASGMYGQYASTAYGGLAIRLFEKVDLDAGYFYEYYNTGAMIDNSDGGSQNCTTSGLRYGLSLRI